MKRLFALAAIATLGAVGTAVGPVAQADLLATSHVEPVATASHRCGSGYTHAVTPGGHKCLQAGQYCSHAAGYAKAYREAGYRCKANGRLARR